MSAERLAIRWLETRSADELAAYPGVVALARGVVSEAFSGRVITPGVTTTRDVAWYIRQRFADLDLAAWFMPDVNLQRPEDECAPEAPFCGTSGVIRPGDVLHTDVGICYMRLCTDTQEMGYVARPGEEAVPPGLRRALADGNRWQDLLTAEFARRPDGQRDPRRGPHGRRGCRPGGQHLQPPAGALRPRAGADDRHVGQPGADPGSG